MTAVPKVNMITSRCLEVDFPSMQRRDHGGLDWRSIVDGSISFRFLTAFGYEDSLLEGAMRLENRGGSRA
jgi:hypothetical protein